jgi:TPR repeat protein
MNWTYIGIAALLPLTIALVATLLAGAIQATRSNQAGGSSRVAFQRLLRTLAVVFPLAFLIAALWDGRSTWRGLIGVALGHPADQRSMGLFRSQGEGFLKKDPIKAASWFRKAAEGGDVRAKYLLARALATGTGVIRDSGTALHWAEAAAKQGDTDAMVLAGDLLLHSAGPAADAWYRQALTSLQLRIAQREAEACLAYGLLLVSGKGNPRDPVEGLAWMKVAERLGLPGLRTLPIRLIEARMPPIQRTEATQRAEVIQKTLPPKGKN